MVGLGDNHIYRIYGRFYISDVVSAYMIGWI